MRTLPFVIVALITAAPALSAQNPIAGQTPGVRATARTMRATRVASAPKLDGVLDEAAWGSAQPSGEFTQSYPNAGAAPTQKTDVRVLYDDAAIYIGARMFDAHPDSIAAQLARRDASGIYSDWLHVVIDSYHDRRSGFRFSVNPKGVKKDVLHSDDRTEDLNWDAVWEVATTVDSLGWTAEYRIPFSQLRFGGAAKGAERLWGLQVQRDIARRSERDSWSPWKQTDAGYISFAGDLTGIADIPTPQRLEIMPYVSGKLSRARGDKSNPFYSLNDFDQSGGADLKYGLPGGLTLTATVNPDFGQVEVDPAVVNLSAFESFFPEKRPFFVEGANIFNLGRLRGGPSYGSQQIFYSRRIGRSPQRSADGDYVDAPDATTILGAVKLTGKAGPWTVGVLNALTPEENASIISVDGLRSSTPVEPASNYFVSRIRREFNAGNTVISGGGTAVNRDVGNAVFTDLLRSRANVGSIDFEHQWSNHVWALTGAFAGSQIAGSKQVITNAQRTSAHYYQRPDADYLEVDPDAEVLNGHSISFGLNKSGAWSMGATAKQVSPGYDVNDLGFMGRVDYRNLGVSGSYTQTTPGKHLRDWSLFTGTNHAFNFGGDRIWTSFFGSGSMTFKNLWYVGGGLEFDPGAYDDRLTRGGPLGKQPTSYGGYAYGGTDSRKRVVYNWSVNLYPDAKGGYFRSLNPSVDIRPSSNIKLTLIPGISQTRNTIQYVKTVTDPLATSTFGARYVFADLHQTTLSATTRVTWTLTPMLSFELFAQPFTSSGDYKDFKELLEPKTLNYRVFGKDGSTIKPVSGSGNSVASYEVDSDGNGTAAPFNISNPDFSVQSLRGNAVVRWEYRPGSALFFVWQQQRSGFDQYNGEFRAGSNLRDIFSQPSNVFLVKATYWFAR
jgi:hypothetical protein